MDEKDLEGLRELVQLLKSNGVSHFELERTDWKVQLSFGSVEAKPAITAPGIDLAQLSQLVSAGSTVPVAPQASAASMIAAAAPEPPEESPEADVSFHTVKSPLVGTFYASPSPGAEPFVKVGDRVTVGQVLCIVEAMKLMNEVEADAAGEIVKVFPDPGQPVEYGQALFAIR